jgi:hypothetical protein
MHLDAIRATYEIILCFVLRDWISCHAPHVDNNDPHVAYLGASRQQIAIMRVTGDAGDGEGSTSRCLVQTDATCFASDGPS